MSWIRGPGLIVFVVVMALLAAGVWLAAPWAIERAIEAARGRRSRRKARMPLLLLKEKPSDSRLIV